MANKPEDIKRDEQNLEEYLQGDSALSKAYGAEQKVQVPGHLDKAILSAANESVKAWHPTKVAYSPFARSWYVPVSMAAVLMLCVSLVFTIYKDSGQTILTTPKSEYDIDARTVLEETVVPMGQGETESAGKKSRIDTYEDKLIQMETNKSVPSTVEEYEVEELKLERKPASSKLSKKKTKAMNDAIQAEIKDKNIPKKDAAVQIFTDAPYPPDELDLSGSLEAADVKQQKQIDADVLNNKSDNMELQANEEETDIGASSVPALRYRQEKESFSKGKRILKEESLEEVTIDGLVSPAGSLSGEIMSAELWLNQINDQWLSGDHQVAKENLRQFLAVYPDYPIEK